MTVLHKTMHIFFKGLKLTSSVKLALRSHRLPHETNTPAKPLQLKRGHPGDDDDYIQPDGDVVAKNERSKIHHTASHFII